LLVHNTLADKVTHDTIGLGQKFTLDGVTITIINPTQPLTFGDTNDDSVVLMVSYGAVDFLITGDCEGPCENAVVSSGLKVDAEILKVGHHGSKTSTSQGLLTAVTPEVAVISVGQGNRYGHPYASTLSRLDSNGITYYRTDLYGTIVIETDGSSLYKDCQYSKWDC
jgi:beta-lactamase superfamily II metal-dependent hydrolase